MAGIMGKPKDDDITKAIAKEGAAVAISKKTPLSKRQARKVVNKIDKQMNKKAKKGFGL